MLPLKKPTLKVEKILLPEPITEENSAHLDGSYIYINTPTKIYRYNIKKNTFTSYKKSGRTSFYSYRYKGFLYILSYNRYILNGVPRISINVSTFDMVSKTYTFGVAAQGFDISEEEEMIEEWTGILGAIAYNKDVNTIAFQVNLETAPSYGAKNYFFDFNIVSYEITNPAVSVGMYYINQQYEDRFMEGSPYFVARGSVYNTDDEIVTDIEYPIMKGFFIYDDVYFMRGKNWVNKEYVNDDYVYILDDVDNTCIKTDILITDNIYNRTVVKVDGKNYIFVEDGILVIEVIKNYLSIDLYKNSTEPNRVDKTNYLENIGTLRGVLRDETTLINPSITIQQTVVPQFNYVYIPIFNRYYYVTNVTSIRNNLWEIDLSVDVLMSHKDKLLDCVAFIDRNEDYFAPNSIDNERVVRQGTRTSEVYGAGLGFPNIMMRNIDKETFQSEMCVVLNGYKLEAVRRTE